MAIQLNTIKPAKKYRHTSKRLGRGDSSGKGSYCGRGLKGQRSRSGGKSGLKLKGLKRNILNLPKFKGIKSIRPKNQIVSLAKLNNNFKDNEKVTPEVLASKGLVDNIEQPIKILKNNDISVKIEVAGCLVSAAAQKAIEKAGGKVCDSLGKLDKENSPAEKKDDK